MWRTTVNCQGVAVDSGLRASIDQQIRTALRGIEARVGHVHVRLYREVEETGLHTCYIRVDALPSGGIALGDTGADAGGAVARAAARIGAAVRRASERGPFSGGITPGSPAWCFLR